ncbi:hypothetical protein B0H67DRAFT_211156 [Lasiosphaeris hirsuta]|uniref:Uncharacterized protein n=1 Tax=Lasiosphaeris hirsuta TaxID=260670 RepID=A0AA40AS76_9PEZI|nr:hypothetical protein B0H67DRAFT_211156 [Lasiosphaeris hirsuta]
MMFAIITAHRAIYYSVYPDLDILHQVISLVCLILFLMRKTKYKQPSKIPARDLSAYLPRPIGIAKTAENTNDSISDPGLTAEALVRKTIMITLLIPSAALKDSCTPPEPTLRNRRPGPGTLILVFWAWGKSGPDLGCSFRLTSTARHAGQGPHSKTWIAREHACSGSLSRPVPHGVAPPEMRVSRETDKMNANNKVVLGVTKDLRGDNMHRLKITFLTFALNLYCFLGSCRAGEAPYRCQDLAAAQIAPVVNGE